MDARDVAGASTIGVIIKKMETAPSRIRERGLRPVIVIAVVLAGEEGLLRPFR
jgi:hypothetical protein